MAHTETAAGLTVHAEWDPTPSPTGVQVDALEWEALRLEPHAFHGEWNYTIHPQIDSVIQQ